MKNSIISIVAVNIICIAFIAFTCFMRFGTNIKVIEDVDSVPAETGAIHKKRVRNGTTFYSTQWKVRIETPGNDDFEPFWVDGVDTFGTNDQDKLKAIVEAKEHIKLNIFINPDNGDVLGVTTNGTSILSLFYHNNKLLRYGSFILLGVDVFAVILILTTGRSKSRKKSKQTA